LEFNGLPPDCADGFDEESPDIFHPFRDLFLSGLLGFVKRNDQDAKFQRFRQPDDSLNSFTSDLPVSSHYFIHPALSEYIQRSGVSDQFRVIQQILVGENAPWYPFDPHLFETELALSDKIDAKLRGRIHDFLSEIKIAKLSASPRPVRHELESSQEWRKLIQDLTSKQHDDVLLWLEELLESQ